MPRAKKQKVNKSNLMRLLHKLDEIERNLNIMSTAGKTLPSLLVASFLTLGGTFFLATQSFNTSPSVDTLPLTGGSTEVYTTYEPASPSSFNINENSYIYMSLDSLSSITEGELVFTYNPDVINISRLYLVNKYFQLLSEDYSTPGIAKLSFVKTDEPNTDEAKFIKIAFTTQKPGTMDLKLDTTMSYIINEDDLYLTIPEDKLEYLAQ